MTALVCPNGHAMDEGLFECPCCGAYRPSRAAFPDPVDYKAEMERGNRKRAMKELWGDIKGAQYDRKVREMEGKG